mmetsp:Transcript_5470/g.7612  ORF Transcript_5470/g.7612 Transcript_5470/m.7612 type:complete len:297 (+) Transcript_5470:220-1110(+)|eukprot:CAMPEP_0184479658 /NCGR_PEP_ID=MMETSP0113_2-20130426/1295_1 /TAXON_ID=91329 /ORGANISM="Norrisiella sphaerica, Strain BC52" /LENGTH=296 /DNA_ID=CAMNT_0026857783 /DNA_START=199 /DNA_END=1092 /DNA_ORIENTATION=+
MLLPAGTCFYAIFSLLLSPSLLTRALPQPSPYAHHRASGARKDPILHDSPSWKQARALAGTSNIGQAIGKWRGSQGPVVSKPSITLGPQKARLAVGAGSKYLEADFTPPVIVLVLCLENLILNSKRRVRSEIASALNETTQPFYLLTALTEDEASRLIQLNQGFPQADSFTAYSSRLYGKKKCGRNGDKVSGLVKIQKRAPPNARFVYVDTDTFSLRQAGKVPELKDWELFYASYADCGGTATIFPQRVSSVDMGETCEIIKSGAPCGQVWDTYLPGHDQLPADSSTTISDSAFKG